MFLFLLLWCQGFEHVNPSRERRATRKMPEQVGEGQSRWHITALLKRRLGSCLHGRSSTAGVSHVDLHRQAKGRGCKQGGRVRHALNYDESGARVARCLQQHFTTNEESISMATRPNSRALTLLAGLSALSLIAGCGSMGGKSTTSADTTKPAASATPGAPKIGPGMNERGEVTDPKKVEAGYGEKIKGLDDWEGEITGKPVPGGKFARLKIGMSATMVTSMLGEPTAMGAHQTGKAWIPFYFGSDKYRYEITYKGVGRLLFANQAGMGIGDTHLIWIIHSAAETGEL